jgi:bifunctional DNA-binding transcriptional regulator/antitoxin component of YhaV-PrlF toxin-antitoxin module
MNTRTCLILNSKVKTPYYLVFSFHRAQTMTTLTVTARGQVTFRREVLQHLGIKPGERIEFQLLPNGRAMLSAVVQPGSIHGFVGLLAGRSKKIASMEEINAGAARGWTGQA